MSSRSGLTISLWMQWHLFHIMTPIVGTLFAPLGTALRDYLLLALPGFITGEVTYTRYKLTTWGLKQACVGVPDPTHTSPTNFDMPEHFCGVLITSMINGVVIDIRPHATHVREGHESG